MDSKQFDAAEKDALMTFARARLTARKIDARKLSPVQCAALLTGEYGLTNRAAFNELAALRRRVLSGRERYSDKVDWSRRSKS